MKNASREIIERIIDKTIKTKQDLENAKRKTCKKHELNKFMTNSDILKYVKDNDEKEKIIHLLQKKPTRTISGVAIVAVMCHPHKCPHGRCSYCTESSIAPPSYTGEEPAALRGRMYDFDPYKQTYNRLKQLYDIGHPIDKVELIIMGGTFPSRFIDYQEWFISKCLMAMNDYSDEINENIVKNKNILKSDKKEIQKFYPNDFSYLNDIQKINENSNIRCIGITFETRPDYCKREDVDRMLKLGVTRVELGVQTTYDSIYKAVNRGHTISDVIEATRILKDSGEKVAMHLMPGLLSTPEMDIKIFKRIFDDSDFKPDMIKIYPLLITKGSEFYDKWKKGEIHPYTDEQAVEVLVKLKKILPKWVRTMRIQRDIPSTLIEAGVKKSNLGELVYNQLEEENINCKCIRCREIGHLSKKPQIKNKIKNLKNEDFKIFKEEYIASKGKEIFLSYEDTDEEILAGFLRLRFPSKYAHRQEINENTALIRELHVYGNMLQIGEKNKNIGQHVGFGENLIKKAEKIAIENNKEKILITSGIGAREYYRKFGYEQIGPYMGKYIE